MGKSDADHRRGLEPDTTQEAAQRAFLSGETDSAETVLIDERTKLVVTQSVEPRNLRRMLGDLRSEDCVHSWKNLPCGVGLQELVAWENAQRPTKVFFYYACDAGGARAPELTGAATVAESIDGAFPLRGFPVVARCYVRPAFRNQGLYRRFLVHRLDHCRARFGDGLKAIHIGTANHRIATRITRRLDHWPPFTRMGDQELQVGGVVHSVGVYLLFAPGYREALKASIPPGSNGGEAAHLEAALRKTLAGEFNASRRAYEALARAFERACTAGLVRDGTHASNPIQELLDFCRAVPVAGSGEARAEDESAFQPAAPAS